MKIATVVELDPREVLDAIGERAKASLPKGEHMGGRTVDLHLTASGEIEGATVTFNGTVAK